VQVASGSVERLRYLVMTTLARYPAVALPLARLRGEGVVVDERTELLVESFPRCASSFALATITLAQAPRVLRVAHHTHAPANVLRAIDLAVPALVLIRTPEDVVVSNMIRHPRRTPNDVLRGFLRFYEPLQPRRSGFVVATYDEVIGGEMASVIRRLNGRFGTDLVEFGSTPENVERIMREIDEDWRHRRGGGDRLERIVPRPSEMRERMKADLRARFRSDASPALRDRAEQIYGSLARADAGTPGP
jgi:hypothetical protein